MSRPETLTMLVKSVTWEAQGIVSFDLRPTDTGVLPPFTAGAHIDVHLPNGLVRSYSLMNPQEERHRYQVAVNRDAASRGGSSCLHETVRVGQTLTIGLPRNNFPLAEDAAHSVLIAGGIGITPLWCMVQRLAALKQRWTLYYCTRSRAHAAFLPEVLALAARSGGTVVTHFDQEAGGKLLDLAQVVAKAGPQAHLYCCGPLPMLAAFEAATAGHPPRQVHVEYFAAREAPATQGGFTVVLARSGRELQVPEGRSILDVLLDADVDVLYSCTEGVCGACETRVLEGTPDHRDLVLSKDEQAAGRTMMICCSGSKSPRLVLDL